MTWWDRIAHLFSSDDDNKQPSEETFQDAQDVDRITRRGEDEEYFEAGEEMGTVPLTPHEYEGEDTDEHPAIKQWWQFWK